MFRRGSPKIMFVLIITVFCIRSVRAADFAGVIQGVVRSASGQPLSGAYVKLLNVERQLTFMVISGEQGRYSASRLPAGKYSIQAIGGESQSKQATLDTAADRSPRMDLSLTERRAPALPPGWPGTPGTIGGAEAWNKMPPPVLPDGPGKEIAQAKCGQCHGVRWTLGFRGSREEWAALVDSMRSNIAADPEHAKDFTNEDEVKLTVDYFAKHFSGEPRPDPNSRLQRTLLKEAAAKYIAVDYKIPRVKSEPHEITVDARGVAWIGERGGGRLARFDPAIYTFTEITPPMGGSPRNRIGAIVKGEGNKIWMVDGGPNRRWLAYDTQSSEFNTFPAPKTLKGRPNGNTIRQHPNGTVWVASGASNAMYALDPKTRQFYIYEVPSGVQSGKSVSPYGFAIDGAGKIWFAEYAVNGVGRLDPATGKIDEFKVPVEDSIPRKVTADSQGNIWVALHETGQILRIDYQDPTNMKLYTPPTQHPGTYSPCGDLKNGYIWFSEQGTDQIARFDPKTETWLEFSLPNAESDARRIEVDQNNPNRVWWSGTISNRIGYIEVLP